MTSPLRALLLLLLLAGLSHTHSTLSARTLHRHALTRRAFSSCAPILSRHLHSRRTANRRRSLIGPRNTPTATTDPFHGAIPTCVLAPESAQGPYWLPKGYLRSDIRESQPGIDLQLDVQIFNAQTCSTLSGVVLDFWSCNSTGVYSGFRAEESEGETWLRGAVTSGNDGIARVTTKFPGHYVGRAVHVHVMAHVGGMMQDNETYVGGTVPHVGQLYFEMPLVREVVNVEPYRRNQGVLVENGEDALFAATEDTVKGFDGVVTVERLGDRLEDGLLGYISVGIDPDASGDGVDGYAVSAAGGTPTSTGGAAGTSGTQQAVPTPTGSSGATGAKVGGVVVAGVAVVVAALWR